MHCEKEEEEEEEEEEECDMMPHKQTNKQPRTCNHDTDLFICTLSAPHALHHPLRVTYQSSIIQKVYAYLLQVLVLEK